MGRPKGGKNRSYTKEEKMKYVKLMLEDGYSVWKIEKEFIENWMLKPNKKSAKRIQASVNLKVTNNTSANQ